jgi:hypothetical protein
VSKKPKTKKYKMALAQHLAIYVEAKTDAVVAILGSK